MTHNDCFIPPSRMIVRVPTYARAELGGHVARSPNKGDVQITLEINLKRVHVTALVVDIIFTRMVVMVLTTFLKLNEKNSTACLRSLLRRDR